MIRVLAFLAALLVPSAASAQAPVVAYCYTGLTGTNSLLPCSSTYPLPVSATVSASVSPFAPGGSFATLTSTASSADHALPTGTVVALFNTGTSAVSCTLTIGAGVAVASENIIQASSWFAAGVGTNTHYSCINQAGDAASNVVVASGGAGLPAGSGGGGGSSSNASVSATGSAVPASATYIGIISGGNLTGWTGAVTNAGTFPVQASVPTWAGGTLGAMANYGTSPGAVLVPGVNSYCTNCNSNGPATGANSSPVVQASDYVGNVPIANLVFGTTSAMTGTSSTQLLAAVSSKILYAANITCTNSSATGTLVTVQDGSAGTTLGTLVAGPSDGGHVVSNATIPWFKTTAGNGLYVADVTTSASVICTASGWHN